MVQNPLVGVWRLISCELSTADGEVSYPWGRDASAYIMYTPDGYMSYQVMAGNRTLFASGDLFGGTAEEQLAAVRTYQSYCGTYEFRGDSVIHHVEVSSFPNWVGQDQVRFVSLVDDVLTLSAAPLVLHGKSRTARLIWKRA